MILTEDGSRKLREVKVGAHADKTIVYVSGEFGGAEVTLVYFDDFKEPIPIEGGQLKSGKQYMVYDGVDVPLSVQVSKSTPTTKISIVSTGIS